MSSLTEQPRPPDETRAAAELAFETFGGLVGHVEQTHRAFANRSFGLSGAAASPAKLIHDGVSTVVYGSIRGAGKVGGALAGAAISARAPSAPAPADQRRSISSTRKGAIALGALNGWAGDRLNQRGSDLAVELSLRDPGGGRIGTTPAELAAAHPGASRKLALFIHGLTETERTWWFKTKRPDGTRGPTYGERLAADLGYTPLYLRYNSGLRVSQNGRLLNDLLEEVVSAWPVEVDEIAVFGFSMGGLLIRSANHQALESGSSWVGRVRQIFHLGAPHHGAPLERWTNASMSAIRNLPETGALRDILNARSGGVKDMRYGNLLAADWEGFDPDEHLRDRRNPIPFMETASHYFLAATLTPSPEHPISRVLGDLLVLLPSAWAENAHPRGQRFETERSRHYGGITHFHLANHPAVYAQIREWLQVPGLPAGAPAAAS